MSGVTRGVPPLLCPGDSWHTAAVQAVVLMNGGETFRKCAITKVDEDGTLHLKHKSASKLADGTFVQREFKSSDKGAMLVFDGVVNYAYVVETPGKMCGTSVKLFS